MCPAIWENSTTTSEFFPVGAQRRRISEARPWRVFVFLGLSPPLVSPARIGGIQFYGACRTARRQGNDANGRQHSKTPKFIHSYTVPAASPASSRGKQQIKRLLHQILFRHPFLGRQHGDAAVVNDWKVRRDK